MLYLAVGMPRAGSARHYRLIHDLVVSNGGKVSLDIRNKNKLNQHILTEVNCNIGIVNYKRVIPLLPYTIKDDVVIKTHSGSTRFYDLISRLGLAKSLYVYRDPRAAALSAHNFGMSKLAQGMKNKAFTDLTTIEKAIDFIAVYVDIWKEWSAKEGVLVQRFEDILADYEAEALKIVDFLGVDPEAQSTLEVIGRYASNKSAEDVRGLHFYKGEPERFRTEMTPTQLALCEEKFGDEIIKMGYEL
jgi:hypothetical protein